MNRPRQICYVDAADKRRRFQAEVIPGIYNEAARSARDPSLAYWLQTSGVADAPAGLAQLVALHDLARAGTYRTPAGFNCDPLQAVAVTIDEGGDCDQWAAVLLAAFAILGYEGRLMTFGDAGDRFQHVAVAAKFGRDWYILDPKGDAAGLEFNEVDETYKIVEAWNPTRAYDRM